MLYTNRELHDGLLTLTTVERHNPVARVLSQVVNQYQYPSTSSCLHDTIYTNFTESIYICIIVANHFSHDSPVFTRMP